jgi:hypothetical protein
VDEVGYALLARSESMLDVGLKHEGKVRCVECRGIIETDGSIDEMIICGKCGWECALVNEFDIDIERSLKCKVFDMDDQRTWKSAGQSGNRE